MAYILDVERDDRTIKGLHRTAIPCRYSVAVIEGKKTLQLTTYGSDNRIVTGQPSQTLQFTENTALQLYRILRAEFGFKE